MDWFMFSFSSGVALSCFLMLIFDGETIGKRLLWLALIAVNTAWATAGAMRIFGA